MPRLLDTKLVGYDIADVNNKTYTGVTPGWVLKVAGDGESMELGPSPTSTYAESSGLSFDSDRGREGLTFQQSLCRTWTNITPSGVGTNFSQVTGIAYGRGRFVAVGVGAGGEPLMKYAAINGTVAPTWAAVNLGGTFSGTDSIWGVKFFGNQFIAYGQNGKLATSVDGALWSAVSLPAPGGNIYSVAYAPGQGYLAVGQTNSNNTLGPGVAWFSSDTITWTALLTNPLGTGKIRNNTGAIIDGPIPMYGVVWAKGKFVVVGGEVKSNSYPYQDNDPSPQVKHIAYSITGNSDWIQVSSARPASSHYVVEYGNGRFVVGANESPVVTPASSSIMYSNDGITWQQSVMTTTPLVPIQGNTQSMIYGNGVFVAATDRVYVSTDGVDFNNTGVFISGTWPGTPPSGTGANGTPGTYGNGLFVLGTRGGQIIRSAFGSEVFGASSSGGGGGGVTPIVPNTVVTRNISSNTAITTTNQSYLYILDVFYGGVVFNVPVNTNNTLDRVLVNIRHPDIQVGEQAYFSTGSIGSFAGIGDFFALQVPCLLEFYRFPNSSTWYYEIIYGFIPGGGNSGGGDGNNDNPGPGGVDPGQGENDGGDGDGPAGE